jgi:hypothetical protein
MQLQETWRLHLQNFTIWLPFAGAVLAGEGLVWFGLKGGDHFLPLAGILVLVSSGFGALVFQGLLSSALDLVLLGVIPTIAMAVIADALFSLAGSVLQGENDD